jgi:phosphate transport system protein
MNQLSVELQLLKSESLEMAELVRGQVAGVLQAVATFDHSLIEAIELGEKQVDTLDLRIERKCEQLLALFSPVARDLRFVFATNKIISDFEGISDNAHAIGKYLLETRKAFTADQLAVLEFTKMSNQLLNMLDATLLAFEEESVSRAQTVMGMEAELDRINLAANKTIAKMAAACKTQTEALDIINLLTIIRKMEKIGDYLTAIAGRVIYFIEARIIKHREAY